MASLNSNRFLCIVKTLFVSSRSEIVDILYNIVFFINIIFFKIFLPLKFLKIFYDKRMFDTKFNKKIIFLKYIFEK